MVVLQRYTKGPQLGLALEISAVICRYPTVSTVSALPSFPVVPPPL
jgi:hypothetical protein